MPRQQLTNSATSSAPAALTSGTTSIVVTTGDGALFPSVGNFQIVLHSTSTYEIVTCTSRSTDTLTVVRGQEGTTGVAHPAGVKVVLTLTPEIINRLIADDVETARFTNVTEYGIKDIDGQPIPLADWTWLNQGTATAAEYDDGSLSIFAPGNVASHNNRILHKSLPTPPYTIRATIIPQLHNEADANALATVGIGLRDSTGGRIWQNAIAMWDAAVARDRMLVRDYSATTTFSSNLDDFDAAVGRNVHWFEIFHASNDDVTFRSSANGMHWWEFTNSASALDFDQAFFFAMPGDNGTASNNGDTICTLVGWDEE